ncbi:MAG: hypothetical protein AB7D57_08225 [Desulfovibrionaceae bacterium]
MSRAVSRVPLLPRLRLAALALTVAAALALPAPARAGERPAPNIAGEWTFAFTNDSDGSSYADPCTITQDGERFTGVITYMDGGRQTIESFEGRIAPDGSVSFTLYDQDQPVRHLGQVSADGRTIAGAWSMNEGSGTFTLTRGPTAAAVVRPNLTGAWILAVAGADAARPSTDPCTLTQDGEHLWGTVHRPRAGRTEGAPLEGSVTPDGAVEFSLGGSGVPVRYQGRLAPDGASVSGAWNDGAAQGDFHLTRAPLRQAAGPTNGEAAAGVVPDAETDDASIDTTAAAQAGPAAPDISGSWVFTFTNRNGQAFSDPCAVTQAGGRFRGAVRHEADGEVTEEPLTGNVDPAGNVVFTLWDRDRPVEHRGRLTADGARLEGRWAGADGSGSFAMTRDAEAPAGAPRPDLTGNWVLTFAPDVPKNAPKAQGNGTASPALSDACVIKGGNQGRFSGEVRYFQDGKQVREPLDGVVSADGTVRFILYDAGRAVEHSGRLDPDTGAVIGRWSHPGRSGSFTLIRQ